MKQKGRASHGKHYMLPRLCDTLKLSLPFSSSFVRTHISTNFLLSSLGVANGRDPIKTKECLLISRKFFNVPSLAALMHSARLHSRVQMTINSSASSTSLVVYGNFEFFHCVPAARATPILSPIGCVCCVFDH